MSFRKLSFLDFGKIYISKKLKFSLNFRKKITFSDIFRGEMGKFFQNLKIKNVNKKVKTFFSHSNALRRPLLQFSHDLWQKNMIVGKDPRSKLEKNWWSIISENIFDLYFWENFVNFRESAWKKSDSLNISWKYLNFTIEFPIIVLFHETGEYLI